MARCCKYFSNYRQCVISETCLFIKKKKIEFHFEAQCYLYFKKRQLNICRIFAVDYIRRNAKRYFDALYVNKITDYKAFLKNIQPLFLKRENWQTKQLLRIVKKISYLIKLLYQRNFQNETKTLSINENSYIVDSRSSITDPVGKAGNTYKNQTSILLIKQKLENEEHFLFKEVSISEIEKELRELNFNKVTTFGKIPTNIFFKK